jgi:hypothetical protein
MPSIKYQVSSITPESMSSASFRDRFFRREKKSAGSTPVEFGFIPKGAIGKTVGLSYEAEAEL